MAGKYRHRIAFQRQITARDDDGVLTVSWDTVPGLGDVPAAVLTGPGREAVQSGQMQSNVAARIQCMWFPGGIDASWRIIWGDQVFAILGIPDMDATARREYRITCSAGITDGQ